VLVHIPRQRRAEIVRRFAVLFLANCLAAHVREHLHGDLVVALRLLRLGVVSPAAQREALPGPGNRLRRGDAAVARRAPSLPQRKRAPAQRRGSRSRAARQHADDRKTQHLQIFPLSALF